MISGAGSIKVGRRRLDAPCPMKLQAQTPGWNVVTLVDNALDGFVSPEILKKNARIA
jgi:hypothetical protein